MDNPSIWIAMTALILGCFFAACHVALKTYSRSDLTNMMHAAGRAGQLDRFFLRLPQLQLVTGTVRTCLNLVVLLAILYAFAQRNWGGRLTAPESNLPVLSLLTVLTAFAVSGALVTVFSVAIPLSVGRYVPEKILVRSMGILCLFEMLFRPVAIALHVFDPIVRRISGGETEENSHGVLSEKIMTVVEDQEAEGAVDFGQKQMIEAVFDLTDTTVGEIMTPRTEVTGIEAGSTLAQAKDVILREGHSRIPVYEGNVDHIIGVLYAKDLLQFLGDGEGTPFDVRNILREAMIVPQSKWVRQLLGEFQSRKVHIAIVLDEYGGTAGLVTIEDILEELVGEIQDEYEPAIEDAEICRINENTYEVDARVHVDDLNKELHIELPEDEDYETVGGFVFATLGHIPDVGERFHFADARFTVTDAERTKVNRVSVEVTQAATNLRHGQNGIETG